MSSAENVVPINGEQQILEGFPVIGTRFNLVNDKRLATEKVLAHNDHVTGTFSGRVKGFRSVEIGGDLVGVYEVEVLKAEIE